MKKCPYCAEEIQDEAAKCRFCGEFLSKADNLNKKLTEYKIEFKKEVFSAGVERVHLYTEDNCPIYTVANCPEEALEKANPELEKIGYVKGKEITIRESQRFGKFSCPKCESRYTNCEKEIGCFFTLITLGLALILLYPFVPYKCHCRICGYDWKA